MGNRKRIVIIGAGPAGLTAAYELLRQSDLYEVVALEQEMSVGGLARTVEYHGNRMDIGGHRFYSKIPAVNRWWEQFLPVIEGDDASKKKRRLEEKLYAQSELYTEDCSLADGMTQAGMNGMLLRRRVSHIYFNGNFYDYPVTLEFDNIRKLGIGEAAQVLFSYVKACLFKRQEISLEDFYINRFGKKLYSLFFEYYTENVWGRHPDEIDPSWGAQRVKGVSLTSAWKHAMEKHSGRRRSDNSKEETSFIEEFKYPAFGPGQLWEKVSRKIQGMGGSVRLGASVRKVVCEPCGSHIIDGIVYEKNGAQEYLPADIVISTMPLKDLVASMQDADVPADIAQIADQLPYRDYITVGVLLTHLALGNPLYSAKDSSADRRREDNFHGCVNKENHLIPDDWIYIQDRNVRVGRIQIYNNWSPFLVKYAQHTVWLGMEYFCNENDLFWKKTDDDIARQAVEELREIHFIDEESTVIDCHVVRVKKAYPAYFDSYKDISRLRAWLDTIPNLICIGRNGQHRYNNMDHSMCTAFEAVTDILNGTTDHTNIWKAEEIWQQVREEEKMLGTSERNVDCR